MMKAEWWEILETFEEFEKAVSLKNKDLSNLLYTKLEAQLLSNPTVPESLKGDWIWSRMYEYLGDYSKAYEFATLEVSKIRSYLEIKQEPLIKNDYDEDSLKRSEERALRLKLLIK